MEMIDVITKLREIAEKSPEVVNALDNATRMSAKRIEEGVQITVSGSDAVLHQILKLAGMIGAETVEADSMDHGFGHEMGHDPMGHEPMGYSHYDTVELVPAMDEAGAEERPYQQDPTNTYGAATSPDEVILDFDTAVPGGSDLHRHKGTYPKVAGGDNPMA